MNIFIPINASYVAIIYFMVLYFLSFVGMASSFGSKRHRSMKHHLGKASSDNDAVPAIVDCGAEDLLNQTRFFSQQEQIVQYASQFYARTILSPKVMSLSWFQDDDKNGEEPPQPDDDVQQATPQGPVSHDDHMFSQIMKGIQDLQQGFNNLRVDMHSRLDNMQMDMRTRFDSVHNRIDQVKQKIDDFLDNYK